MSGSSTLCSASARGSRLNIWKTNPISLLRMRASSSSARSLTFWPLSQYSPLVGVSRQPMRFISVDLPDPDGPITATYSFLRICTLTPRSARTSSEPMSYSRVSLCVRMMTSGSGVSPVRNSCTALVSAVQLFRTGDTPLPDVIILTHKLTREYDMGSELVRALRGVNVQIQKNEYVAVMGPSGSGKSTLMNLIGCLDTPTSGEYWLNGQKVSDLTDDEL